MRLAITIQTEEIDRTVPVALLTGSLSEKAAKAADWGADGLELMSLAPRRLDWGMVLRALQAAGLQAAAVASGAMAFAGGLTLLHADRETAARARARLRDLIDFAEALAAPTVTIGSFRGRLSSIEPAAGDARKQLADILIEAAEYAAGRSVRLAVEAINRYETDFIHTANECLEFTTGLNRPEIGVLLDTFHMNIEEAGWGEAFGATTSTGKLYHVHLGDNNRYPPGRGMIDFGLVVSILADCGYTGWLSAELLGIPDPDSAARQTLTHMRRLLADLRPNEARSAGRDG